ncbi:YhdP family protein [Vibrio algicola]|uniref:TIGR02099 family protein n=1 Tax=Vibrio algicola TaxID=2662262 RepID=A0A5Q0TBY2_9VIBR|nr:YhdP family protein [Vibrio algicola]
MTFATRLWRSLLWIVLTGAVLLAVIVIALRVFLPNLNQYRGEIESKIFQSTGVQVQVGSIKGYWENLTPSLALKNVKVVLPGEQVPIVTVGRSDLKLDLYSSLIHWQPKLDNVTIQSLQADVSRWSIIPNKDEPSKAVETESSNPKLLKQIKDVFLKQLGSFSVLDSSVIYLAPSGDVRQLDIDRLRFQNNNNHHKAEGVLSIAGVNLNKVSVIANFTEHGDLRYLDGDFFVSAQNIRITPWMTKFLKERTTIHSGRVSVNGWLTLKQGKPTDALVELQSSNLRWGEDKTAHQLVINHGVLKLKPVNKGWAVQGQQFDIQTDSKKWLAPKFALDWQPKTFAINVSQIEVDKLTPFVTLLADQKSNDDFIKQLQPTGLLTDIRVDIPRDQKKLTYSATLTDGSIKQHDLLPGFHKLSAKISGNKNTASIKASIKDDELPYGEVFQAPLRIKDSAVNLVWQSDNSGWKLWADKVEVSTPDLKAVGAFRLDFPKEKSPFLSFYAEADVLNAGETWRYLPTLALGRDLTDYLSAAIQGGTAKTAKLIWYGPLSTFPYHNHDGIFQIGVGLKNAKFSFDTAWPAITNLQLNLLFENDAMYLDSHSAKLMGVDAERITGKIPSLAPDGHIEITAKAKADGKDVRDYMLATPLVDSVGAALSAVQVSGPVTSTFKLNIPFDGGNARAWGYADLKDSPISVQSPPIDLTKASGRITFDNDVVKAKGIKANLLDQPISLDFTGQNQAGGYGVDVDVLGETSLTKLQKAIPSPWLKPLNGSAPWNLNLDLNLNDVGFTYQIDSQADLEYVTSSYPAPLGKGLGLKGKARMQAAGDQEHVSARITLPTAKYQADIDIRPSTPVIKASNFIVGKGDFKVSPIGGNYFAINTPKFDADKWIDFLMDGEHNVALKPVVPDAKPTIPAKTSLSKTQAAKTPVNTEVEKKTEKAEINFPVLPMPENVHITTKTLKLADLDWHNLKFLAVHQTKQWQMNLNSSEAVGSGQFVNKKDLRVNLSSAHIFVPQWEQSEKKTLISDLGKDDPLISDFDRQFHKSMPNLDLKVSDLWLQGYKVGTLDMQIQHDKDKLVWKTLDLKTGSNHLKSSGWWQLAGDKSHSNFKVNLTGDNNSEVMARFGISSGVQKASFVIDTSADWDGAPWSMKTDTLQGHLSSEFKDGVITDVNGAARLLGLFSLDSIIRKMKLDFTGVFDDGMTFDSIKGTGKMKKGVFVTNDLGMDGSAGDLKLRGSADLNTRLVDAEVTFYPDLTSSIPIVAAFAVTPQTALAVFALTKVLSPVVDVFTKVQYSIKGPLDAPDVKEISRSKGEYKLNEEKK